MNRPEIETAAATAKPEVLTPTMAKLLVERDRLRAERDALADTLRQIADAHVTTNLTTFARAALDRHTQEDIMARDTPLPPSLNDLESAWGIIANAYHGNWDTAPPEWKAAAERWRDEVWHPALDRHTHQKETP